MAGLLEILDKLTPNQAASMGLLNMGASMIQAGAPSATPTNLLSVFGSGISGFGQGYAATKAEELAQSNFDRKEARQSRLDDATINKDNASADYYRNGGSSSASDGYHAPVQTSQGWLKWNAEKRDYEPIMIGDNPALPVSADVPLAGRKENAVQGEKFSKNQMVDGSEMNMPNKLLPTFRPSSTSNNNVGNIRPPGQSTGFQQFDSPEQGIAAIDQNLAAYGSKYGINTLSGVINRWSPPSENDTPTLIKNASQFLGLHPDQPIDLSDPKVRQFVIPAIMKQENGVPWKNSNDKIIQASNPIANAAIAGAQQIAPQVAQQFGQSTAAKKSIEIAGDIAKKQAEANIEIGQKKTEQAQKELKSANRSIDLIKQATPLVEKATNSGVGALADSAMGFFGKSTEGADSAQALKALGANLVMQMPRMEGPQSDKDTMLYKEMAGQLGDPWVPRSRKIAALQTIQEIQGRYAQGAESQLNNQSQPTQANNGGWAIKRVQ